jgi:hypothetical protein
VNVRREKGDGFQRETDPSGNLSFQPVAIGTAAEAMKLSELSM